MASTTLPCRKSLAIVSLERVRFLLVPSRRAHRGVPRQCDVFALLSPVIGSLAVRYSVIKPMSKLGVLFLHNGGRMQSCSPAAAI